MTESITAGWAVPGVLFLCLSKSLVPSDAWILFLCLCRLLVPKQCLRILSFACLKPLVPNGDKILIPSSVKIPLTVRFLGSYHMSVKSLVLAMPALDPFLLSVKTSIFGIAFDSCTYPQCVTINCIISIYIISWSFLVGGTWMQVKRGNCLSTVSDNSWPLSLVPNDVPILVSFVFLVVAESGGRNLVDETGWNWWDRFIWSLSGDVGKSTCWW